VSLPGSLAAAIERATGRAPGAAVRVGGGDINDAWRVELDGGERAFVKTRPGAPPGEYTAEAEALRWLGEPGGLGVPDVLGVAEDGPRLLALRWIDEGGRGDEAALGAGLAAVHQAGAPAFGGDGGPLRIGAIELPNDPLDDWPSFYAEHRLRPLVGPAVDRGALSGAGAAAIERVCDTMSDLAGAAEPPARLHGDLWSGNVLWDRGGRPWLIDPAAYGGHREVDLAMLRLFGAPGPAFLAAYEERRPLADGHAERVELWQLFPLLVHTVLFGGGYGASAERVARLYA
jgi:fructosamine-3-kinase